MTALAVVGQTQGPLAAIAAEAALIGALLLNNRGVDLVAEILPAEDFFDPFHRFAYEAILSEVAQGRGVSPVTLRAFLSGTEQEKRTSFEYLVGLTGTAAVIVGQADFARQIVDYANRRRLVERLQQVIADASEVWERPLPELVAEVDEALNASLRVRSAERSLGFAEAFDQTVQAIEDEAAGLGPQGIRIAGLADFNSLTGDLRRGELMYLGGRPSMGKTALSLRLALGSADAGNGTLFISLEMRVADLTTRAIADLVFDYGQSPGYESIRRGRLDHFTRERMAEARQRIANFPLILTDPSSLNIGRLAMMIRRYTRRMEAAGKSLDLVVIDYLGLIKATDSRAKRYEAVGEISRTLKEVAKECDVALVVLAQLNRECERRDDKRPMLSDLRDAGDIEQDADHVMFVYRDEYYLERSEPEANDKRRADWETAMGFARDRMEIIAAKVRNGRVGKRNLYFFAQHQAVRDSTYMRGNR